MNLLERISRRFRGDSAKVAKDRLQIIVAHERAANRGGSPDFLPMMQQEIIDVIAKYFTGINRDKVKVELQRTDNCSVLELNVALPEQEKVN